ncbi:MAG: alpha/beta fold hydrolase, partial [Chitinophagaceae bacterium]
QLQLLALVSPKKAAKFAFRLFSTPLLRPAVAIDPIFEKGELLSFQQNGEIVSGFRWNHPAKRKVLIVHGFESNSAKFSEYIKRFVNLDFEVLAFDAPAHGNSGAKRVLLPDYVQMLTTVIGKYGPIENFIAHSFGGLSLMMTLESIINDEDFRLALIAPATETTSAIDRFFNMFGLGSDVRKEFDAIILAKAGHPVSYYSIRRSMTLTKANILWIHDDTDNVTPIADALRVKEDSHPNMEFITTTGLGHRRIYRDENVVNTVVKFIDGK